MKAELIDSMGTDLTVVNAARVSMDKESSYESEATCPTDSNGGKIGPYNRLREGDQKLLSYLARENHWTPFSHPQICMRETVPIFVARQRFKHMVGFTYNEVSRRYVDTPPQMFTPASKDIRSRPDGSIKQGSGGEHPQSTDMATQMYIHNGEALLFYNNLIAQGVAPEQARMVLPQSMYTSYYVTGSLAAWARAYKQRSDDHSQLEIQDLAASWDAIIRPLFPESWGVLTQ